MIKLRTALAAGLVGVLALAGCGSDEDDPAATNATLPGTSPSQSTTSDTFTVTVGSADFAESQLLAEIYASALENNGVRVARKDPIGSREAYYPAIVNNEVQLLPEYTNSLLSFVLRQEDPAAVPTAKNVEEQVAALMEALPDTLTVGNPSTAEDKDVIVCSQEAVEEHSLTNLSDLFEAAPEIKLGAPAEFEGRSPYGLAGFRDIYGAEFEEFVPLQFGVIAESVKSGAIDCGSLFSTTSAITTEGLIVLEDDQTIVPNEAVLPLMRKEIATPEVLSILDQVNAQLTTDILKSLMVKIEVDLRTPLDVAREFLASLSGS